MILFLQPPRPHGVANVFPFANLHGFHATHWQCHGCKDESCNAEFPSFKAVSKHCGLAVRFFRSNSYLLQLFQVFNKRSGSFFQDIFSWSCFCFSVFLSKYINKSDSSCYTNHIKGDSMFSTSHWVVEDWLNIFMLVYCSLPGKYFFQ